LKDKIEVERRKSRDQKLQDDILNKKLAHNKSMEVYSNMPIDGGSLSVYYLVKSYINIIYR